MHAYVTEFECRALKLSDDIEDYEKIVGKLSGYRFSVNDCYYCDDYIHPLDLFDMIDDQVAELLILFKKKMADLKLSSLKSPLSLLMRFFQDYRLILFLLGEFKY